MFTVEITALITDRRWFLCDIIAATYVAKVITLNMLAWRKLQGTLFLYVTGLFIRVNIISLGKKREAVAPFAVPITPPYFSQ